MRVSRFAVLLLLLVSFSTMLFGQGMPTSTLTGMVRSQEGGALPGVTVTVRSPNLQGSRSAVSGETGEYLLSLLPPGDYTATFELSGLQTVERRVTLSAARTERLDVSLGVAAVSEAITVTATTPVTAAVESTQVSTNFRQDLIEALPVQRNLEAVTLLAPGVTDNGPGSNLMISGAMSFESLYLINGVTVNENLRGQPQDLFIEDAIQETTVLTGSISAEYGRFTGGVVNAVTKSGSNEFSGSFRASLTNESWVEPTPVTVAQADEINTIYEATLGGAILRDRLWFFSAGRDQSTADMRQTQATPRTGDINPTPQPYEHTTEQRRLEGKLTGTIAQGHSLIASYMDVDDVETGQVFTTAILDLRSVVPHRETPNTLLALNYNGTVSNNFFVEAQYSRQEYAFVGGGALETDLIGGTLILDRARGARYNSPTFRRDQPEERNNDSILLKASYFLPTRAFGTHEIRAGGEDFTAFRFVNNYQSGSDFRVSAPATIIRGTQVFPQFRTGTLTRIIWNPIFVQTQGSEYSTRSYFVNDAISFGPHWRFNAGLRYDANEAVDGRGNVVTDDSSFNPRLAAHYDVTGTGRLVFNAGYSRYAAMLSEGIGNDADPAGRTASIQWNYRGPNINGDVNAPTSQLVPTEEALKRLFDWFHAQGGTNLRPLRSVSIPGLDARIAEGGLESPNVKEYTIGVAGALGARGYARADLIYRNWDNFYTEFINGSTGTVSAPEFGGERFDLAYIGTSNSYDRQYRAVQTQFSYRFTPLFHVGGTYTWSRLTGNLTGETSGDGPVTGSADRYPEYRQARWNTPMGYLAADQRHRARVWIGSDFTLPFGGLNVSLLQAYDSGSAYSTEGTIDPSPYVQNPGYITPVTGVSYFFEGRGSNRTDDITRTDLALNFTSRSFGRVEFFLQPEVVNIFDNQGAVAVNQEVLTNSDDTTLKAFNPFSETPQLGVHYRLGQNFGRPTAESSFQTPRTFRVSLGIRF